ncbi:hypothetical protein DV701_04795 [Ornithinimicrobium avium]|uniref:Mycothiol-dependent maleylpyruvate isomerase metal-binding domain-containing protein n=1 Tax=Ornithinimicrobium avium TaxID=2283195 RepID=A0A345NKH9_9MICO|nr:hypothetical protein DV701_04795 [Ornithinimicrobium avium]
MTPTTDGAEVLARLDACEEAWARALAGVADDLDRPSAAEGWSMRDVADHVTGGGDRVRRLVTGHLDDAATRDRDYRGGPGGDLLGARARLASGGDERGPGTCRTAPGGSAAGGRGAADAGR